MLHVAQTLRDCLTTASTEQFFRDRTADVCVNRLERGSALDGRLAELAGRSVVIATSMQLTAALALIELDGIARRITVLPPDIAADHVAPIMARAEADAVVVDAGTVPNPALDIPLKVPCAPLVKGVDPVSLSRLETEWLLLTSGTSGVPKLVAHTHATLTAPVRAGKPPDGAVVWGTFYDIRRYGGLQIFLRAVLGGASLILSHAGEPIAEHLVRLGKFGVTHLSGTPSHWRRALMSPDIGKIAPRYVRLSGEIADQPILDSLRAAFPSASVGHAYASTEAGVAFEVTDGLAGFPASFLGRSATGVEMKVVDGSLRIRSSRTASRYVGTQQPELLDAEGFVDTGDMVERNGDRYSFAGRKGGIINIGGLKVHPEEVEAVINQHPQVRMSLVRPKRSPVTGAIVIADVVLRAAHAPADSEPELRENILALCRASLPRHKVPATVNFVPSLDVAATGKLARRYA